MKGVIAVLAVCALTALVSAALWQLVRALAGWRAAAGQRTVATDPGLQALLDQKARLMQHLRELRFDRDTGKLSDEDYRQLRDRYERAVWVNPDAPNGWGGRTTQIIGQLFPMHHLSVQGLEDAVKGLVGARK